MENKAKRFLRLLLAIAMVMAIVPMTFALATETGNVAKIGTQGYATLAEAIAAANAAEGGATVTLLQDVILGEKLTISGNVTISGAHTITRADTYTGTLFAVNAGATLTLDGGLVIDGGNDWSYIKGEPELDMANGSGTKVVNHITPAEGGVNATAHLIVNKGTLNANTTTIQNSYSTNGVSAIECGANSVTVLDGATIKHVAANRSGAVVYVGGVDAVLTIKGNTRITDNFGISNGGIIQNYGQGTTVNMEGGRIDHNYVGNSGTLYASYSGSASKINTFNMSGGTITENVMEGYGPVYIHTNTVWNMTGGEISYNTSYLPTYVRSKNNAATISGGKIVNNEIAGTDYNNGSYATRPDIYLGTNSKITGGIFTQNVNEYCAEGFVCKQLADGTWRIEERTTVSVTVTIQNATMVKGNALPNFTYTTDVECPELDISYTVDGTAINAIVAEMDGYEFTVIPGTLTVQKAIVRVEANGTKAFFATLEDAIKYAVKATGYVGVHILGDVTVNETIVINDANGGTIELQAFPSSYKITSTMNSELFRVEKTTSFVVKNLTIRAKGDAFYIAGGSLTLQGVGDNSQYLVVTSETGNAIYTRGGNTIVKGGVTLIAHGEYPAIQGNGLYEGNVTLAKWGGYPGVPQVSAPNTDIAIFWPQNGKLTIDAGTITGDTALYAKSGTIIINGGEFYGTGTKVDFAHNSNGAYATGDAVVIESCKDAAYETPVVSITGGTFTSANGEALMFYACDANADAKAIMELTGGTYSSRPSSTWCAEGYLPVFADAKNVTTWSVKEATAVAAIGEEMYANVQHAINDAATGDEIDLVADVLDQPVYVNTDLTLDLNGHTYIQNRSKQTIVYAKDGSQKYLNPNRATSDFKGMINVMGGSLTVKDSVGTGMIESTVGNIFCIAKPLTIENGVFKVGTVAYDGSKARIVVTKNSYTYGVKLDINGGEFYTAEGGMPFYVGFAAGNKSDNVSIEKAWFSESIQTWIDAKNAKGFTYNQSEAKSSENVDGYLVTKGVINVDGVWFGSWDDAESSIKKNSTIVLYADVANTYGGTVAKDYKFPANGGNITLNLNGHTFKSAMSEASKMTTVTVQYGTVLNIIGGGNIVIENNSYPFVINPKSTVKIEEGITFTGTMQWNVNNGNSGDLYIGETAMVGVNGIFKPTAATRIIMNEQGDWTLSMGSLIMTADDATLVNNTLTINKNCKLDLNGNDLTAKKVEGYGNLIDSMDGVGTVTGELWFDGHSNGGYLPLKNGDCYSLFRTNAKIRGAKKVDADTLKIGCTIYFENAKAYELLANMVENNNSSITVTWSGSDVGEFAYNFSKNMLTAFANKAKEQLATNGKVTTSMNLDVDGMSELVTGDIVSSVPSISSNTGVVISGERFSYTIS